MRLAAVPVYRIDTSNVQCSLPPIRLPLVATDASFSMYKTTISIKDFHLEELAQACIFFLHEPAPNTIKTRLSDCLVLVESTLIQPK